MSVQKMESTGCVDMKFIIFLKTTLGKMVAANTLKNDFINLQFWQKWPQKFYNVKSYSMTKDELDAAETATNGDGNHEEEGHEQHPDEHVINEKQVYISLLKCYPSSTGTFKILGPFF